MEMNANELAVKPWRDIEELKIWGNDNGMRFMRNLKDKTNYASYFTDDDLDKLEAFVHQQQAENEALKAENQALKLCETNYPLEKHSKEWFQQQLARSDKIIFMERKLSSDKLDGYRKSKEQVKKKQEIIEQQQIEIEELKDDVKWLYDINVQRYPELKDGQLPVLYVTLNHNGKQIKGIVSLKETRIICDSVKDRLKEISYECK